jgi:hypothetical protein
MGCAGPSDAGTGSPASSDPGAPREVHVLVAYERQGGIAGFHDQLVVRSDGSYTFTGRYRSSGTATLWAAELSDLRQLLQSAGFARIPSDSPLRIADGFIHIIRYDAHEVRAGDGNIPSTLQPVVDLLGAILRRHGG